jgi:hypothetical protein
MKNPLLLQASQAVVDEDGCAEKWFFYSLNAALEGRPLEALGYVRSVVVLLFEK